MAANGNLQMLLGMEVAKDPALSTPKETPMAAQDHLVPVPLDSRTPELETEEALDPGCY